jgi:hypothetical protein
MVIVFGGFGGQVVDGEVNVARVFTGVEFFAGFCGGVFGAVAVDESFDVGDELGRGSFDVGEGLELDLRRGLAEISTFRETMLKDCEKP